MAASSNLDILLGIQSPTALSTAESWELIRWVREGISYSFYHDMITLCPYTQQEWATFLSLSGRTLRSYRHISSSFDRLRSERILRVLLLTNFGRDVFGDAHLFCTWLKNNNVAMGNIEPIELMDSSYGLGLIEDALGRIEYGILA